ncbi:arylamine N-acetyltransferase [Singulisphaera acidiphila]|uniref:arylamine N-acetyltransferase n=1 Tax=Singulisphaera acidiphila TaxID=466153 RepID=UPI000303E773|nr:arylamine N-acetyltransferase [Singulisphaera acidiphila]
MDPAAPNVSVIDIDAHLDRISDSGDRTPTPEVFKCLPLNHLTRIPFENLDIHLGRPIRLDLASLQAKLVGNRRGGYCFEQNALFAAVLEQLRLDIDYEVASDYTSTHPESSRLDPTGETPDGSFQYRPKRTDMRLVRPAHRIPDPI